MFWLAGISSVCLPPDATLDTPFFGPVGGPWQSLPSKQQPPMSMSCFGVCQPSCCRVCVICYALPRLHCCAARCISPSACYYMFPYPSAGKEMPVPGSTSWGPRGGRRAMNKRALYFRAGWVKQMQDRPDTEWVQNLFEAQVKLPNSVEVVWESSELGKSRAPGCYLWLSYCVTFSSSLHLWVTALLP